MKVVCNLPKDHISLDIHGNIWVDLAKAFAMSSIKGAIHDAVVSGVNTALTNDLPPVVNHDLATSQGIAYLYKNTELDWSLANNPSINPDRLEFSIKGLFFTKGQPEHEPLARRPKMPYSNPEDPAYFQTFLSNYVFDSAAETFL